MRFGTPSIIAAGDNSDVLIGTGLASWTGDPSAALYDGSDDTYANTYYQHLAGESTGRLDGIAVPVLDAMSAGDVIPIRMQAPDSPDGWQGYLNETPEAMPGPTMLGFQTADPVGTAIFDTTVTLTKDVAAGSTIYWMPYGVLIVGSEAPYLIRTIQFGPIVSGIPPLRLYPRHDKRIYPPTRSRGARPTGYL